SKFMIAIWQGDMATVSEEVRRGINLNVGFPDDCPEGGFGTTPLVNAVEASAWSRIGTGHPQMVEYLLQHGADPNFIPSGGVSPLHEARDLQTARILLKYGAHVDERYRGETPLLVAAQGPWRFEFAIIPELLGGGADLNAVDDLGNNAVMLAASQHNEKALRLFAALGVDACAMDKNSETALDQAKSNAVNEPAREEIGRFLGSVCNKNPISNSHAQLVSQSSARPFLAGKALPLMALLKGDVNSFRASLPPGTNFNTILRAPYAANVDTALETTPLLLAVLAEQAEMVDFLLQHGADPNFHPYGSDSALILAARHGNLPIVQALLRHGALVNESNRDGETPLLAA